MKQSSSFIKENSKGKLVFLDKLTRIIPVEHERKKELNLNVVDVRVPSN